MAYIFLPMILVILRMNLEIWLWSFRDLTEFIKLLHLAEKDSCKENKNQNTSFPEKIPSLSLYFSSD